ncbi:MAG: DUF2971 domain-containing protein [Candidatus Sulfotelmatobacter sp.]
MAAGSGEFLRHLPNFEAIPSDMRKALEDFDGKAREIIKSKLGHLENAPPPPTIYHYTDDLGLRGILESGQLWLTDIFGLNDPSELKHGFSVAIETLAKRAAEGPRVSQIFARDFALLLERGGIEQVAHFFLCAFSSRGDDLGQWRVYADNGRGYALGFEAKSLEEGFTKPDGVQSPNNGTFPVQYEDGLLREVYDCLIDRMFHLLSLPKGRNLDSPTINAYMAELQLRLTFHALGPVLYFKHEAYSNEQEYRFLQVHRADLPAPTVKLRHRPYALVRYREFDWRKVAPTSLKRIVIGPAADADMAYRFATDCLRFFGVNSVEIEQSKIPYRAV